MVFDRTAISTGRRIQDFGLCDLKGTFYNSARLRAKGYLAVVFLQPTEPSSVAVAKLLQGWPAISDKLTVAAVAIGEREDAEKMVANAQITYPVLWDLETYVTPLWAVTAVPALFVTDANGLVLGRVVGNDAADLSAAKEMLIETIRKADEAAKAAAAAAEAAKAAEPAKK